MSSAHFWWQKDGPFDVGEEGYPDPGQVVRYYRERQALKPSTCAQMLGMTDVAVRNMESKRSGLDSLALRRRLASLLSIPPVLLGLDSVHACAQTPPSCWWSQEGHPPFLPGPDGYPCPGQVVKYYREQKKKCNPVWTQAGLGTALNISDVAVRGMENNNESLDSLSRRRALVFVLGIPPTLLGLDSLHYAAGIEKRLLKKPSSEVWRPERASLTKFRSALPRYWDGYYTSSILDPLEEVAELIRDLRSTLLDATGTQRQQGIELLVRYYQLASTVARDQCKYQMAFFFANRAIKLAQTLDNGELLASALLRRSFISFEQGDMQAALVDLDIACPVARSARPALKGLVLQVAGHVHAHTAVSGTDQKKALTLLDTAGSLAYAGPYEADDNFVSFNADWHHVERAETYIALGRPQSALHELDIAADGLDDSGQARRIAHLNIYRAKAYIHQNELADATTYALNALNVSKVIQSTIKLSLIVELYQQLKQGAYGNSPDVTRLGLLLRSC